MHTNTCAIAISLECCRIEAPVTLSHVTVFYEQNWDNFPQPERQWINELNAELLVNQFLLSARALTDFILRVQLSTYYLDL